ncbi:MAG: DUF3466 family protein, partial [Deltaproteobacteria bacterium]|nr:DUF3466 family protein [Deltaproteobacteria bacterium]
AGDLNGDGFADLLIGNQWADDDYLREGKAYIFYGSASGLSNSADVIIDNPNPEYNVRFGESVDGIGDFNHDGFDDIVVGCPYGSYASIYYGSPEGVSSEPSLILSGINQLGWSVSRVGDIKGNGQNFIIVGEEFGTAYLYALAATNTIDSDNDGLYDYLENAGCTDSFDADTDDDGISDGAEDANKNGVLDPGETDPCSIDTDGDGIQDGTELGITEPVPDPDEDGPLLGTDTNVFIADADSDTTTDPLNKDSDDDGAWDGTEDANHNGRVDAGETDPSNPSSYPAQTTYSIFDLGNMGGEETTASAVNNHGVVVGSIDYYRGAFKWENGQTTILPFLADILLEAGAKSINDKNEIVGFSPMGNWYYPVMWDSANNINDLGSVGIATDINENSQVVIEVWGSEASILWEDDSLKIIVSESLNGIMHSGPNAINENGQVVGWGYVYDEEGYKFAYLWENDNLYDLNNLITDGYSGILNEAIDINNNGQIIGSSWLFEDGNVLDLGFSGAAAINEIGQIVGSNFLYENGRLYNLDELIESEISYTNLKANDINELGQIVGQFDVDGKTHAFLMNPVLDFDCDGLPDTLENSTCTDPVDVDTDDDGISDGAEDVNKNGVVDPGETNPCSIDTDGDGIQDGTELGITASVPDPDGDGPLLGTDTNVFIADADSDTTTDPLNKDSDDDGAWDGTEDANHNGATNAGESDPSNASSYPAQTTIHLKKGFNLIAIPSDVTNQPDLKDWLPAFGGSSKIEKVMVYDGQAGKFITLITGDASNPSFMLQGGEGLFVYAKQDKEITFTSMLCSTHDLRQGFNLIGFACPADGYSAYQLLNDLGSENVSSIQKYSTDKGAFEIASFRQDGMPVGVDFVIVPGEGYFVLMHRDVLRY